MSALLILLIAVVALALGYVFYGSWLAKQWGVDPNRETPAHTAYDGKDFVPANPAVLMGHHFSSIAGAGPINGPIQAAVFGWVPVFLWCVLGGIFFGAMHDFGALFASIRHNGGSIGQVMKDSMGIKAQRLFIVFALAVLILVIASFTAVVAGTFVSIDPAAPTYAANGSTAMTSILFIVIAAIFGFFVYRKNAKIGPATIIGIIGIVLIVVLGQFAGLHFSRTFWVLFIAVYVTVASLLPVWILLQPRDYLSSFLLYGMMIIAVISIIGATFTGAATVEAPALRLEEPGRPAPVPVPVHHGRLRRLLRLPLPDLLRYFLQADQQREGCPDHRLRLHDRRVRSWRYLPDRYRRGVVSDLRRRRRQVPALRSSHDLRRWYCYPSPVVLLPCSRPSLARRATP